MKRSFEPYRRHGLVVPCKHNSLAEICKSMRKVIGAVKDVRYAKDLILSSMMDEKIVIRS